MVGFIAGPYNGDIEKNAAVAREAAKRFWSRGIPVICPHMNTYRFGGDIPESKFYQGYLEMVEFCGFVFLLPNWQTSTGSMGEYGLAVMLGIKTFEDFDEAIRYALGASAPSTPSQASQNEP